MTTTVPFRGASRAADYLDTTERTPETEPPTVGFAPAGPVADEEAVVSDSTVEVPLEPNPDAEPQPIDLRTLGAARPGARGPPPPPPRPPPAPPPPPPPPPPPGPPGRGAGRDHRTPWPRRSCGDPDATERRRDRPHRTAR